MLTAAQARKIQPEWPTKSEILKIENGIIEAAQKGEDRASFMGLSQKMVQLLREHGYEVRATSERNETWYTVKWAAHSREMAEAYYNK